MIEIERYLDLVPEELTASGARKLLDLYDEKPEALRQVLESLAADGDDAAEVTA